MADNGIKGSNTLTLNQATVNTAVEYWLNQNVLQTDMTVTKVRQADNDGLFSVELIPKEEVKKEGGERE